MPDRIVRQGILKSELVNKLSWPAEVFYRRLMQVADDFGRYDGRTIILRSDLYPLKVDKVSAADVGKWKAECASAGLISCYQVAGKEYLEIKNFGQRLRAMKSRFPAPADICQPPHADDSGCPPETETETESETESETETEQSAAAPEVFKAFDSERFAEAWQSWKNVKKKEHRFSFKSIESEAAAQKKLKELASDNEETAIAIIWQSIEHGWKGLYELKNHSNGKNYSGNPGSKPVPTINPPGSFGNL